MGGHSLAIRSKVFLWKTKCRVTAACRILVRVQTSEQVCFFTYVVLHLSVVFVHELKKPQLNLGLVQEGFLVLDDLDGHPLLLMVVIGFHHLHKKEQISAHLVLVLQQKN